MAKWGLNNDEVFVVPSGSLTTNFDDNVRLANTPYVIQAFLYVDYEKGSEDQLEVWVRESFVDDEDVSTLLYFSETIVDNNGFVEPFIFRFTDTGRYRLPIQVGESEDRLKVSVRGSGTPPFTGGVSLYYGVR